jgi:hypothetical protein
LVEVCGPLFYVKQLLYLILNPEVIIYYTIQAGLMLPPLIPLALAVVTHVTGNQLHALLKLLFCLSYTGG